MRIFIIGHISPDLDSVAAAVEYAELLKRVKRYKGHDIIPVITDTPNQETKFVFNKFKIPLPNNINRYKVSDTDKFILVDHNEHKQRHPATKVGEVIEIIDHHKINMNFTTPVRIDMKPYGAMATIIYELYEMYGKKPSKKTSQLILSSILSDTQGLKSSTCTHYDKTIAKLLSKKLKIDIDKWTMEIAKQKSDISGLSPKQIVERDVKVYWFGDYKVFISQIETIEPKKVLSMKEDLLKELVNLKKEQKLDFAYLLVTDIININSHMLFVTDTARETIEKAFETKAIDKNIADIGKRTSRKKDITIKIEETLLKKPKQTA